MHSARLLAPKDFHFHALNNVANNANNYEFVDQLKALRRVGWLHLPHRNTHDQIYISKKSNNDDNWKAEQSKEASVRCSRNLNRRQSTAIICKWEWPKNMLHNWAGEFALKQKTLLLLWLAEAKSTFNGQKWTELQWNWLRTRHRRRPRCRLN